MIFLHEQKKALFFILDQNAKTKESAFFLLIKHEYPACLVMRHRRA